MIMPEHIESIRKSNGPVGEYATLRERNLPSPEKRIDITMRSGKMIVVDADKISSDFRRWLNKNGFYV